MTKIITVSDGVATLAVNFADEGVDLQGQTTVKGGEAEALAYAPFFEADLRRNFADRFPAPVTEEEGEPDEVL